MEVEVYKANRRTHTMTLTRSGYIVPDTPEIKKALTVRPIVNADFGVAPPSFKVFRKAKSDYVYRDFMRKKSLVKRDTTPAPNHIKLIYHSEESYEMKRFKMWLSKKLSKLDMGFFRYLAVSVRRPYPWP